MILFVFFTIFTALPIFIEGLQTVAIVLNLIVMFVLWYFLTQYPRYCMRIIHGWRFYGKSDFYSIYSLIYYFFLGFLVIFGLIGLFGPLMESKGKVLAIFYVCNMILYCFPQWFIFWRSKIRCYNKIKKICAERQYRLKISFWRFFFPIGRSTDPSMIIETPEEKYIVRTMGNTGFPVGYVFLDKNSYVLQYFNPFILITDIVEKFNGEKDLILNPLLRFLSFGREIEKTIADYEM